MMVRLPPFLLLVLPLAACNGAWIWWGDEDEADTIRWSGTILDGPYTGDNGVLTGGTVTIEDEDGALLDEGAEPLAGTPGWWRVQVPPQTPAFFRLAGEGLLSALWSTETPATTAYWYTGALFAYDEVIWGAWLGDLAAASGVDPLPLEGTCWVWGAPLDPDGWVGANVDVVDGAGEPAQVYRFHVGDDGLLSPALMSSIDYFFAFDLAPGEVSLQVTAADDRQVTMTFPAQAGEVITAWYLALPGDSL